MKKTHYIIVYYNLLSKSEKYYAIGVNGVNKNEAIKQFYNDYPTAQIIKVFEHEK